ncbi:Rne/Rng family ribonuclease [Oceanomicrobium pacificus]|uniref:Ribonuclease E n=1 Tax=Oceanomicrobium pacificus TaxID=2692916 RepID=A0A6B0TSQ0_9RHOB|nr:ribonuclease E/G [Oceanomicrobium pacificus]MXU65789.1 Rne/Rng family ribonuclease [Oceanomicrobium pacificus]
MSKKMLIDATHAEETRVVVVEGNKVEEFDFESLNKRQLAGNIYLAKVTRVEPSLQAAFVDYGGNRHGFLAFAEIHPDYYQIPAADREALLAEEAQSEAEEAEDAEAEEKPKPKSRGRRKKSVEAASDGSPSLDDAVVSEEAPKDDAAKKKDAEEAAEVADEATASEAGPEAVAAEETSSSETETPADTAAEADAPVADADAADAEAADAAADASDDAAPDADAPAAPEDAPKKSRSRSRRRSKSRATPTEEGEEQDTTEVADVDHVGGNDIEDEVAPRRKPRQRRYRIQEVIKVRQIMLVQVVKEERGNKGAALTTYLSLAGRYCVLMPNTARGGGISRKITNVTDRKKLKAIAAEIDVAKGAGLIIRTAGAQRTKTEIKRDYEYLMRQWEQIRDLTMKSIAPCQIYEEGSLIKRAIRDLYSREIDEVIVDGDRGYREAKDYMKMLMPSHAKNVKAYTDALPLFARYQVENFLTGMFNPVVQLKSGGYIVFGVTEALVAVDVNSGRSTKESSIEETALKTNLEAAEEVARQLRLRDLAGLIVIDFIDMDERRNNLAVEKRLKDKLKSDRARIQVGRISSFGLLEMSRQRLRPGMLEASTAPCPHCHGTGQTRSTDSLALAILRELEEEGVRRRAQEVLVSAPIEIANYLLNQKREHVAMIESRFGLSVRVEGDPHLISPEYKVERFKTATRVVPMPESEGSITIESSALPDLEEEAEADANGNADTQTDAATTPEGEEKPKKRRRRRGRRRGKGENGNGENGNAGENGDTVSTATSADAASDPMPAQDEDGDTPQDSGLVEVPEDKPAPKKSSRSRSRSRKKVEADDVAAPKAEDPAVDAVVSDDTPALATAEAAAAVEPTGEDAPVPAPEVAFPAVAAAIDAPADTAASAEPAEAEETGADSEDGTEAAAAAAPEEAPAEKDKPKRRGWWSRAVGGS